MVGYCESCPHCVSEREVRGRVPLRCFHSEAGARRGWIIGWERRYNLPPVWCPVLVRNSL